MPEAICGEISLQAETPGVQSAQDPEGVQWDVNLHSLNSTATIWCSTTQTMAIDLAEQGCMAASPISPTLAISFNTLELCYHLHRWKPSLSVEAFAKHGIG
ncbi:hypothetical protein GY45DRAFT_1376530 [Cubamyces sp. BRFM 1775]|nr:hypothetical protein GY45DRAFT_1376530 [Cubamyces sp. BRFM 1775]